MRLKLMLMGLLGLLLTTPVRAATRVAVVDVGAQTKTPAAFIDLLAVELGKQPELVMLERTEISRLLREQALGMTLAGGDAVKAGKLWTVDAFLMLEAGVPVKQETPVRVRLVDTHYGLKLLDSTFLLGDQTGKYPEAVAPLAVRAGEKLALLGRGGAGVVLVSVAPLRSEELSKRWDWLGETLSTGVEQHFGVLPGLMLLERDRTRPLTDERQLTADLPEALRASAVLVDGSFKINRDKGPEVVTLQLRCRRNGQTLAETKFDGVVSNAVELCRRAATETAGQFGVKPTDHSMAAEHEAAMLAVEANVAIKDAARYVVPFDKEHFPQANQRAIGLAEATLALKPDSSEYQHLLLHAIAQEMQPLWFDMNTITVAMQTIGSDRFYADALRAMSVATMLAKPPFNDQSYHAAKGVLVDVSKVIYRNPELQKREEFNDLSAGFWEVWRSCCKLVPGDEELRKLVDATMCRSFEQAKELDLWIIENAIQKDPLNPSYNWGLRTLELARNDPAAGPKVIAFMDELMSSTNPAVRYLGLKWGVQLYRTNLDHPSVKPDEARTQAIANERIALMKSQKYRNLDAWRTVIACRFSDDEKVDAEKHARIYQDIAAYGTQEGLYDLKMMDALRLSSAANMFEKTAELLEFADKPQEAIAFIEKYLPMLPIIPKNNYREYLEVKLRDLQRKYPSQTASVAPPKYQVKKLVTLNGPNVSPEARKFAQRLVVQGDTGAIVYGFNFETGYGYGALRFDTDTFQVTGDQRASSKEVLRQPKLDTTQYSQRGPSVTCIGKNVFAGHPDRGIVMFPANGGAPKLLNEDTGLADQRILELSAVNGKLYALVGNHVESGLMEVDWQAGASRMLFSTRSTTPESSLWGKHYHRLLADERRHLLWIFSDGKISMYHPEEYRIEIPPIHELSPLENLSWYGDRILINLMATFNPETRQLEAVWSRKETWLSGKEAWQPHYKRQGVPWRFVPIEKGLVALQGEFHDDSSDRDVLHFREGQTEPEYMLDQLFQAKDIIPRDLAMSRHGLLMVSNFALYLIPELAAPGSAAAAKE